VILPKASKEGAIRVAKKITKRIDETPLIKGKKLSVSIGIRQWQNESPQEFLNKADKAAYKAKEMKKEFVVSEE
jgi:diguanylate cyclase (GGDEF)-like protein